MKEGFCDWGGEPYNPEFVAHKVKDNYQRVDQLYVPSHVIFHLDTKKQYMVTYIPVSDFILRGQYANRK